MLNIATKLKNLINNRLNALNNVVKMPPRVQMPEQLKNKTAIEPSQVSNRQICVRFTDSQTAFLSSLNKGTMSSYIKQSIVNALNNPAVRNGTHLDVKYMRGTLRDENRVTATLDKQTYLKLRSLVKQKKIKHYSSLIRSFLQMQIEAETSK